MPPNPMLCPMICPMICPMVWPRPRCASWGQTLRSALPTKIGVLVLSSVPAIGRSGADAGVRRGNEGESGVTRSGDTDRVDVAVDRCALDVGATGENSRENTFYDG
jgi:hypothetical protein